jgi:enamine deaminase RidA (YjgF/YER057c/UK114 family)
MSTAGAQAGIPVAAEGISVLDSRDLRPPVGAYSHVATHCGLAFIPSQLPVTPDGAKALHHGSAVEVHAIAALQ